MTIEISHWEKKEKKRKYESWETTNLQTKPSSKSLGVNTPRSTGKGKKKKHQTSDVEGTGNSHEHNFFSQSLGPNNRSPRRKKSVQRQKLKGILMEG
jgi:hypothetical protein